MPVAFYIAGLIAVIATLLTVTSYNAIHALLYLVVSLLAAAVVFYTLGAPFAAALEAIIYAGAIMVLFLFVVMMLNLADMVPRERGWLNSRMWIGPGLLSFVLFGEVMYMLLTGPVTAGKVHYVGPAAVGVALYSRYMLAVELGSMLLLAGLIGAYHFGRRHDINPAGEETS